MNDERISISLLPVPREWDMTANMHNFIASNSVVKYNEEDNRYEITTPYQDIIGRVILFATIEGDQIRLTDGGYLNEFFLSQQPQDMPFHIDIGVNGGGADEDAKMEGDELVIYCTMTNFGQAVCSLAHAIVMVGTGKHTMLMMVQIFKKILESLKPQPVPDNSPLGWPSNTHFEA